MSEQFVLGSGAESWGVWSRPFEAVPEVGSISSRDTCASRRSNLLVFPLYAVFALQKSTKVPANSDGQSKIKTHVEQFGGGTIFGYMALRSLISLALLGLHCNPSHYSKAETPESPSPEQMASLLSLILYNSMVFEARKVERIDQQDLPPIADFDRARNLRDSKFPFLDPRKIKRQNLFFSLMAAFWDSQRMPFAWNPSPKKLIIVVFSQDCESRHAIGGHPTRMPTECNPTRGGRCEEKTNGFAITIPGAVMSPSYSPPLLSPRDDVAVGDKRKVEHKKHDVPSKGRKMLFGDTDEKDGEMIHKASLAKSFQKRTDEMQAEERRTATSLTRSAQNAFERSPAVQTVSAVSMNQHLFLSSVRPFPLTTDVPIPISFRNQGPVVIPVTDAPRDSDPQNHPFPPHPPLPSHPPLNPSAVIPASPATSTITCTCHQCVTGRMSSSQRQCGEHGYGSDYIVTLAADDRRDHDGADLPNWSTPRQRERPKTLRQSSVVITGADVPKTSSDNDVCPFIITATILDFIDIDLSSRLPPVQYRRGIQSFGEMFPSTSFLSPVLRINRKNPSKDPDIYARPPDPSPETKTMTERDPNHMGRSDNDDDATVPQAR
ncbi:hypothetical protein K435DRAFT_859124 [Dendrothele bispora CBS 962.96]|uniref:Uncharacterized protein n=1 Tax=Dendrothele bispora (strain CBS 962.96) TaxID=1314807 RepID=A0A4S8M1R3_DENBC|nr:hypothetical protein K435DRAFT_859124 [Dendrothele bispora CBS 962.96]